MTIHLNSPTSLNPDQESMPKYKHREGLREVDIFFRFKNGHNSIKFHSIEVLICILDIAYGIFCKFHQYTAEQISG